MTCQVYTQLIDIKRWADRGLYEAVDRNLNQLSPEEASIMLRILDHIHVVDRIFQHHLQGLPHMFQAAQTEASNAFGNGAHANIEPSGHGISHPADARPLISTSRRSRYTPRICSTQSCGPVSAVTAATWIGVKAP